MGLRTRNDPVTDGERAFMLASIKIALEEGDVPVKVRNLGKPKSQGGAT